jgi:leader peptidase (prepilin peptidase)/N-methyltransferase
MKDIITPSLMVFSGLVVGSYLATHAVRSADHLPSSFGRSRCDHCDAPLGALSTIPIVSYLTHRGRCQDCDGPIDPVHLIGEVTGALLAAVVAFSPVSGAARAWLAVMALALLATSLIDLKTQRLPDALTGVALIAALGLQWPNGAVSLELGFAAALVTAVCLTAVRLLGEILRNRPGLGWGDVKLASVLALWLGLATPWMLVIASALGLVVMSLWRPKSGRLPFGPFLALGAFIVGLGLEAGLWSNRL